MGCVYMLAVSWSSMAHCTVNLGSSVIKLRQIENRCTLAPFDSNGQSTEMMRSHCIKIFLVENVPRLSSLPRMPKHTWNDWTKVNMCLCNLWPVAYCDDHKRTPGVMCSPSHTPHYCCGGVVEWMLAVTMAQLPQGQLQIWRSLTDLLAAVFSSLLIVYQV